MKARTKKPHCRALIGLGLLTAAGMTPAHAQPAPPPAGGKYVNMGSSFAAGPSIATPADSPNTRCNRSSQNYAHQLARRHNLSLIDVSCGGSTTVHLLEPWKELPPQLDAVDADTLLVTMTTGGNDLGYLGGLSAMSCANVAARSGAASKPPCGAPPPLPDDASYAAMESRLRQIVAEVHRRAPKARLVIVDYVTILPPTGVCAAVPLSPAQADTSRGIAQRLDDITVRVAKETGTELIPASKISEGHDACAKDAWLNGYPSPGVPVEPTYFHPRLAAMTAIADALDRQIWLAQARKP
jgi:lysophospholipase L1-like esterase